MDAIEKKLPSLGRKFYVGQLLYNSLNPAVQLLLDWLAYVEYSRDGELSGLVAPHKVISCVLLAFCIIGSIWHSCKMVHSLLVLHHVYKCGWKVALKPRDKTTRISKQQSFLMFNIPWRWIMVVCHERSAKHYCEDCTNVFDRSEYWIDEESMDTIAGFVYDFPTRVVQFGWLCRPRTDKQIATAAASLSFTLLKFGKMLRQRVYFPIRKGGGFRDGEGSSNWATFMLRSMLFITNMVLAAYITFDKNEGLPDVYVYATQTATPPITNVALLCEKLHGTERTTTPFLLLQVLDTDEAKATCQLWNSPIYVTLQLDKGNHQIYHVQSLFDKNSEQCRTVKATYELVFVEQSKGERLPPERLSQTELQKRRFSGEAKEHGKCVLKDPLAGDGAPGHLAVPPSCMAERS